MPQCFKSPGSNIHKDWITSKLSECTKFHDERSHSSRASDRGLAGRNSTHQVHRAVRHSRRRVESCNDNKSRVQLPPSAVNVTLLTFAAERCTVLLLLLGNFHFRWISHAPGPTAVNLPHAVAEVQDGTDGYTDTVSLHKPCQILCE